MNICRLCRIYVPHYQIATCVCMQSSTNESKGGLVMIDT